MIGLVDGLIVARGGGAPPPSQSSKVGSLAIASLWKVSEYWAASTGAEMPDGGVIRLNGASVPGWRGAHLRSREARSEH